MIHKIMFFIKKNARMTFLSKRIQGYGLLIVTTFLMTAASCKKTTGGGVTPITPVTSSRVFYAPD